MGRFAKAVKVWAEQTKETEADIIAGFRLDIATQVIELTPVGDPTHWKSPPPPGYTGGQAKGNWFSDTGSVPTNTDYSIIDKNGDQSIGRARDASINDVGGVFYIVNNLPYISTIEYLGWNGVDPYAPVRQTVLLAQDNLERIIKREKRG